MEVILSLSRAVGALSQEPSSVATARTSTPAGHASERPSATSGAGVRIEPYFMHERRAPSAPAYYRPRPRPHGVGQAPSWAAESSSEDCLQSYGAPMMFDLPIQLASAAVRVFNSTTRLNAAHRSPQALRSQRAVHLSITTTAARPKASARGPYSAQRFEKRSCHLLFSGAQTRKPGRKTPHPCRA